MSEAKIDLKKSKHYAVKNVEIIFWFSKFCSIWSKNVSDVEKFYHRSKTFLLFRWKWFRFRNNASFRSAPNFWTSSESCQTKKLSKFWTLLVCARSVAQLIAHPFKLSRYHSKFISHRFLPSNTGFNTQCSQEFNPFLCCLDLLMAHRVWKA